MLDLRKICKSVETLYYRDELAKIKSLGLADWSESIGLKSLDELESLIRIKKSSMNSRIRVKPRQFIAMCIGMVMIKKGIIDLEEEYKMHRIMGLKNWLSEHAKYGDIELLMSELELKIDGIYRRIRVDKRQFIATVYGLKLVK